MTAYYNDNDCGAIAWLGELMRGGYIQYGRIDDRDIREIEAGELAGVRQAHFFAGIGGWPYALRLARWPQDEEVWSLSCPCPPFSSAGRKKCPSCGHTGFRFFAGAHSCIEEFGCKSCGWRDPRHLWPEPYRLIKDRRPATIFGEQVSSPLAVEWFAGVRLDLARIGYTSTAVDIPAAGVGAPHIRQRLWWVADSQLAGSQGRLSRRQGPERQDQHGHTGRSGPDSRMEHPDSKRCGKARSAESGGGACGSERRASAEESGSRCNVKLAWGDTILIPCGDGKSRRIKPGLEPLAYGLPGRVGLLRGYGNAICPEVAARFIVAYKDAREEIYAHLCD